MISSEVISAPEISIKTRELKPLRDMKIIEGSYMDVTDREFYKGLNLDDYYKIILTDEKDIPDAINKLRAIYKNIMSLEYKNTRTMNNAGVDAVQPVEDKSPFEMFEELYKLQNNISMDDEEKSFIKNIMEEVWEEEL